MRKNNKELPKEISVNGEGFGISIGELFGKKAPEKKTEAENPICQKKNDKISRWSLQRQTAGRGGKTVTLVVFPKDSTVNLEMLAKEMRKGLGCGSHVEENKIVLQGDIQDRADVWLKKRTEK